MQWHRDILPTTRTIVARLRRDCQTFAFAFLLTVAAETHTSCIDRWRRGFIAGGSKIGRSSAPVFAWRVGNFKTPLTIRALIEPIVTDQSIR
jgi:hypothetical protein